MASETKSQNDRRLLTQIGIEKRPRFRLSVSTRSPDTAATRITRPMFDELGG